MVPCHEYAEALLPSHPHFLARWREVDIILTDGGISHPDRRCCAPTSAVGIVCLMIWVSVIEVAAYKTIYDETGRLSASHIWRSRFQISGKYWIVVRGKLICWR